MKVAWGAKLWRDGAKMPTKATPGSSGYDVYAWLDGIYPVGRQGIRYMRLECGERCVIKTGVNLRIPEGYEVQVRPKSGMSANWGVTVLNTPGTIDSDFFGNSESFELGIILINHSRVYDYIIEHGAKIAQIVLAKTVDEKLFDESDADYDAIKEANNKLKDMCENIRIRTGGFGSTGI